MDDIIKEFFGQQKAPTGHHRDSFLEKYGLEQNPFPPNRMIFEEVLYGQQKSINRFILASREILLSETPRRRALGIIAGTGGGKTHFLRHCQYKFQAVCAATDRAYAITEFTAGTGKLLDLVRDIYRAADQTCRLKHETDLIGAVTRALETGGDSDSILGELRTDDLRQCFKSLLDSLKTQSDKDQTKKPGFDVLLGHARRWLHAETLNQTERKQLGVFARLSTSSMAIKVQRETLELARDLNILEGLFLCIDEMESLFKRGLSQGQIQSFLQDLRYLFDESIHGEKGFSLFLLTASTTTGASDLIEKNYPIYQRLGYEGDNRMLLEDVKGVGEAIEFAGAYIDFFHQKWLEDREKKKLSKKVEFAPRALLSPTEIQNIFVSVSGNGVTAPHGPLLDALNKSVEDKRGRAESRTA